MRGAGVITGTKSSATRFLVQILQLQNIPFENDCNRQMTLKFICVDVDVEDVLAQAMCLFASFSSTNDKNML